MELLPIERRSSRLVAIRNIEGAAHDHAEI
jgi:hypothetical protein